MKTMKISDVVEIIHQELSRWDHHAVSTALENIVSDLTKAITFEELPAGSWFRYKDSIYFKRESGSYAEFVNRESNGPTLLYEDWRKKLTTIVIPINVTITENLGWDG